MKVPFDKVVSRLTQECRECLELAVSQTLGSKQAQVEPEHLILQLIDRQGELARLCQHLGLEPRPAAQKLAAAIAAYRTDHRGTPILSPRLTSLLEKAWMLSSLVLIKDRISASAILFSAAEEPILRESFRETPFARLPETWSADTGQDLSGEKEPPQEPGERGSMLERYTQNLTAAARAGTLAPVLGREDEISQMVDILTRQRQNNPILVGDAGVGKTAVVEGFAQRVARGEVPEILRGASVHALDLGMLQAGTSLRGAFEQRLKNLVDEIRGSLAPVILFIDEVHMLVQGGQARDHADAANLIKPALARGELRVVGATTWTEYRRTIEPDAALSRRFQMVTIAEPDEKRALSMLRGAASAMSRHHGVVITEEAVREAVHLSRRYLTGQQLPDKAVRVLDTACTRAVLAREAQPAILVTSAAEVAALEAELDLLVREAARPQAGHEELEDDLVRARTNYQNLFARWTKERELVAQLDQAQAAGDDKRYQTLLAEYASSTERPLVPCRVDANLVASVISAWTGIPMGKMLTGEIKRVLTLKSALGKRVIGQDGALDVVCRRLASAMAELADPGKPVGVFLLIGPSGIGKTETAHALAELMFGGERNLVTINMSEFQEAHSVSALKGAPPGYVGYGKGGVLTEAVRRAPYSVVLLDEVEKAHPDVMEIFFQVFDKGYMEDGEGRTIDFKNTVILLTSNLGSQTLLQGIDRTQMTQALQKELESHFQPAFLGRLVVVPYLPLSESALDRIIVLKLNTVVERMWRRYHAKLHIDRELVALVARRCREAQTGARNVDHILTQTLLPELSLAVLSRLSKGHTIEQVRVKSTPEGLRFLFS